MSHITRSTPHRTGREIKAKRQLRRQDVKAARSLARAVDLPARSFDLARPGVAPLLQREGAKENDFSVMWLVSMFCEPGR